MRKKYAPFLPAAAMLVLAALVYCLASGAFKFLALPLGCLAVLAGLWGASCRCQARGKRALRIFAAGLAAAGAVCFGILEGVVIAGDRTEIHGEPQIMIILGAQVKPWGPSVLLRDRLDTALDYLEDHPDIIIVVSGGKGADEHISEAQCMYDYLTAHGADPAQVLMEDRSRNTWQNLRYTFALLEEEGLEPSMGQVLVVSNGFHLARVRMLFGRVWGGTYSLSTLAAPSTDLPARVNSYLREAPALLKSWLLDR